MPLKTVRPERVQAGHVAAFILEDASHGASQPVSGDELSGEGPTAMVDGQANLSSQSEAVPYSSTQE